MKKIFFSILFTSFFIFGLAGKTYAFESTEEPIGQEYVPAVFTEEQKDQLRGLGYTELEISNMTEQEYKKVENLYGEIESRVDIYVKESFDLKTGKPVYTPIEKETYKFSELVNQISPLNVQPSPYTDAFLHFSLSISNTNKGTKLLKNSFSWIGEPYFAFSDVVGISYQPNVTEVKNTRAFVFNYINTTTKKPLTKPVSLYRATQNGLAAVFDLPKYAKDRTGYLQLEVEKTYTDTLKTNTYAHYNHSILQFSPNPSFSVDGGSMISSTFGIQEERYTTRAGQMQW